MRHPALAVVPIFAVLVTIHRTGGASGAAEPTADVRAIRVHVADADGKPVAEAQVGVLTDDSRGVEDQTDVEGRAVLRVPQDASVQTVWAVKGGAGADYQHFREGEDEAHAAGVWLRQDFAGPVSLRLDGALSVTVKVVDEDTQDPLADSIVIPWYLYKPDKGGEFNVSGLMAFSRTTNEGGTAVFDFLPADNGAVVPLLIRSPHHVAQRTVAIDPRAADGDVVAELVRKIRVSGRVVAADGSGAAGATVLAAGDGYHYGYFRTAAKAGEDGTFELEVSPEEYYSLIAHSGDGVSRMHNMVVRKAQPIDGIELALQRGTRLYGQVTLAPDGNPVADYEMKLRQRPAEEYGDLPAAQRLPNPHESRDYIQPILERTTRTDEFGRFEFLVGPGSYYLVGPFSAPVPRFTIADEAEREVNLVATDRSEFTEP